MCHVRISSHCASRLQHVVIVTNCTRQAVVNLCVVSSLQTVLSMYGMVYHRTQILVV